MDGSHESMAGIEVTTLPELAAAQVALNMAAAAEAAEAAAAAVLVADAQHTATATGTGTGTGGPSSPSASHSLINHLASDATHPHAQNGDPTLSFANSAADVSMADNSLSNSLSHSPDDSNASLGERSRRNQPRRTIRKACDLCHSTKVKCIMQTPLEQPSVGSNGNVITNSGPYHRPEHPCQRCIKVGRDCVFSPLVKRKSRTSRQSYGPEVMLESDGNGWGGHPSDVEQARQARLRRAAAASSSSSSLLRQPSFPYDPVASSSSITLTPASAVTATQALAGRSSSSSSSVGSNWDVFGTLFGFDPLLASSSTSPTTLHNMPASAEEVTQFLASFEAAPWSTELQNLQEDVCVHTAEHQQQQPQQQPQQHPGAVAAAAPPDPSTAAADASALTEASAFFAQHSNQLLHPPPPPPAPAPTTSGHDQQHHNILTLQQHPTLHSQQPSSSSSPSLSSFHSNLAQPGWFPSPSIPTQSDHSLSTNYTQPGTQPAAPAPTTTSTSDQTAAATAAQPISSSPSSTALADPNVAQRALEVVMADTIKRIQDLLERERRVRQRAEKRAGQAQGQGQGQGQSSLDVTVAGPSRDPSGASIGPNDNTEEEEVEGLKTSVSAGLRTLALAIRVVERATAWPADMNPSTVSNGTASSGQETLTPTTTTTTNGTSITATSGTSGEHRSGQCHSNGAGTTSSSPGYTPAFAMLLFALGMQVLQALEDLSHPLPPHLPAYPSPLRALPELAIYAPDARTLDTIRASLVREQAAQMKVCMERLVVITQARHHGGGPCITRMIAKKLGEICAQVAQA